MLLIIVFTVSCPYILNFWSLASTLHCGLTLDYGSENGYCPGVPGLWLPFFVKIQSVALREFFDPIQPILSYLTTAHVFFLSLGTGNQIKPKPSVLELETSDPPVSHQSQLLLRNFCKDRLKAELHQLTNFFSIKSYHSGTLTAKLFPCNQEHF